MQPQEPGDFSKPPLCREHWRRGIIRGDFCAVAWLRLGAFGLQGSRARKVTKWQKMRFHLLLPGRGSRVVLCELVFVVVYFVLFKDKNTTTKTTLILKIYFATMISLGLSLGADFFNLGRLNLPTHCYLGLGDFHVRARRRKSRKRNLCEKGGGVGCCPLRQSRPQEVPRKSPPKHLLN